MLHSGSAWAQQNAQFADLRSKGKTAFSNGQYEEAARFFRQAFEIEPLGSLLYNIGLCYEKAGDATNAIVYYERFVAAMPGSPQRVNVTGKIAELKRSLEGQYETVRVESAPSGAVVFVNDKSQGAMGTTPTEFKLLPGSYTIIVEAKGYEPSEQRLELRKGMAGKVQARLVSSDRVGSVRLLISEAGAQIRVDGRPIGRSPLAEPVRLSAGKHELEVMKPGYGVYTRQIEVQAGGEESLTVDLSDEVGGAIGTSSAGGGSGGTNFWPWVVTGVGVAAVGGAVFTGFSAQSLHEQLTDKRDKREPIASQDVDTGNTMVLLTNILYGVGGAAVLGGVAWWLFDGGPLDRSASTSVGFGTTPEGGSSVTFMGTF